MRYNGERQLLAALLADTDECIIWLHSCDSNGYGVLMVDGVTRKAHRTVCQIAHGNPPTDTHEAAHGCGVRACINHRHLRWATPRENCADKVIHGTLLTGQRAPSAKLTDDDVAAIRAMYTGAYGEQSAIARKFGVTSPTINAIVHGKRYVGVS